MVAEYMSREETKSQMRELLRDYRRFHEDQDEEEETQPNGTDDDDDLESQREKSEIALRTFEALFCNKVQLSEDFLKEPGDEAFEEICATLMAWSEELDWPDGQCDGTWYGTARDAYQCAKKIEPFTRERTDSRGNKTPRFWPLVKAVNIYLDTPVLESGLILVDLPGYTDTNLVRVKATKKHLHKCERIFVVAEISRVVTNEAVWKILKETFGAEWQLQMNKRYEPEIVLVCTKKETIEWKSATMDFPTEAEQTKELEENIETCKKKLGTLKKKLRNVRGNDELQLMMKEKQTRYSRTIRCLSYAHTSLPQTRDLQTRGGVSPLISSYESSSSIKFRRKLFWIRHRSNEIREKIDLVFQDTLPQSKLVFFSVSNKDYRARINNEFDDEGERILSVEDTGIPELRRYCRSIQADRRYVLLMKHCEHHIVDFISSMARLTSKERLVPDEGLWELAAKLESHYPEEVKKSCDRTTGNGIRVLLNAMADCDETCLSNAIQLGDTWTNFHFKTVQAFCRKGGEFYNRKVGFHNWNQELLQPLREEIQSAFSTFDKGFQQEGIQLFKNLKQFLETFRTELTAWPDNPKEATSEVCDAIKSKEPDILSAIESISKKVARRITDIELNTMTDDETSYFRDIMQPLYDSCARIKGKGSSRMISALLKQHLTDPKIWEDLRLHTQKAIKILVSDAEQWYVDGIGEVFKDMYGVFEDFASQHQPETQESIEIHKMIRDFVAAAQKQLEENIKPRLATTPDVPQKSKKRKRA
ncbi:MAG: hypothetical protein M1833_005469 [Piccolia ochrophora]|nr:MAG: hypothetical protein M1833_005469 [Piccolia ochrophora]